MRRGKASPLEGDGVGRARRGRGWLTTTSSFHFSTPRASVKACVRSASLDFQIINSYVNISRRCGMQIIEEGSKAPSANCTEERATGLGLEMKQRFINVK